jgi:LuxR family maltose regulon positive regulatory protein
MVTGQAAASDSGHTGRAAERGRVVASKLAAPSVRPGIVARPELVDRLQAAGHASVVLVSAPAGYGKTTLLALWRARDERPFAWLSLDDGDNDPVALVSGILRAFTSIVDIDPALTEALAVPDPPLEDVVLPGLVDACAVADRPFVLVLDDLHLVTAARCHSVIGYLAERLPAGSQIALATRADPAVPVARMRAYGRLVEVRASELSLAADEADALLSAAGVHLPSDRVAQLVDRT